MVEKPSLIVDARVLATLKGMRGNPAFSPRYTNYAVSTYLAACDVMQTWASQLSSEERTVGADEIERWAFGDSPQLEIIPVSRAKGKSVDGCCFVEQGRNGLGEFSGPCILQCCSVEIS